LSRFFFLFLFLCSHCAFAQQRFQFSQPKMGSPFNLIFYADDSARAAQLAKASFRLVDSLNAIFSDYMENSELARLSNTAGSGQSVPLSPLLYEMLAESKKAAQQSKGAFDITVGPLSRLWRQARREKKFPAKEEVLLAKKKTGIHHLMIDTGSRAAKLSAEGMQLDLGGIAKGYVAQKVVSFLQANGALSALADAGGDMACSNPPPGKGGWKVGINVPESETDLLAETIEISNSAIATSGDMYQYMEHEGKRYSHIVDPRTGYGVPFQRNVTIIAPDGATADWLATACSILPLRQCKKLVRRFRSHLLITQLEKGKVNYYMAGKMKRFLKRK
jgi:thiamine biosynthesis lipoprotein